MKRVLFIFVLALGAAACVPDGGSTGVPDGTALTPRGDLVIDTAGTVLDSVHVTGQIDVYARDVVIRNSKIEGNGDHFGVRVHEGGSVAIETTDIFGNHQASGISGSNWSCRQCEFYGLPADGGKLGSNVTVRDSYFHSWSTVPGNHADGLQLQDGGVENVLVTNNRFDFDSGEIGTAMFIEPFFGDGPGPVVIDRNSFSGGNYSLQIVDGNDGKYFLDDVRVTNNVFQDNAQYGPLHVNVPLTRCGNTMQDSTPMDAAC